MHRRTSQAATLAAAMAVAACAPASAPEATAADGAAPPPFDVGIDTAYLTQAVQDRAGSVPLVQGRPGLLRVFLRARTGGVTAPAVHATLVESATGAAVRSWIATSPLPFVPTGVFEEARGGSWNVDVPADEVRAGRHLVVELDPVPGVPPDRFRGTYRLPPAGSLDVRPGSPLPVLLVPVIQSGLSPDVVTSRPAESWVSLAGAAHPVPGVDLLVGAPYTTGVVLRADGGGWSELLRDLDRKRVAEGSPRIYLGAVRTSYTSGTAGRAIDGGRAALASDAAGFYPRIAAHELGHSLGLMHAPCGTSDLASVDPTWPTDPAHAGAHIGVSGWDPRSGAVLDPAETWDLMSYCGDTGSAWTSDHDYVRALAGLAARATMAAAVPMAAAPAPRTPCLLVSGRVVDGHVDLDPVHAVETVPSPAGGGEYEVEVLAGGAVVTAAAFDPALSPAEEPTGEASAHFALAIPLAAIERVRVERVVVRRRGVEVAARSRTSGSADPGVRAVRGRDGSVSLEWSRDARAEAMIRDPGSGEILAFARGGVARLDRWSGALELQLSDGVRSDPPVQIRER